MALLHTSHVFFLMHSFLFENRTAIAVVLFAAYLTLIRCARSRYFRHLDALTPSSLLDDLDVAHRIIIDTVHRDQWFLSRQGLENGVAKTFAVPSISKLLASTGEFRCNTERRSDDVDLLVMEFFEHRPSSARAELAIRRMNAIHGKYKISQSDYVYVLCIFACESLLWIEKYGWRRVHPNEKVASYVVWKYIGERMGIEHVPDSYDAMEAYLHQYEVTNMKYAKSNVEVLGPMLDFHLAPLPPFARPFVLSLISAVYHRQMRRALDLPDPPPAWAHFVVLGILRGRAFAEEYLLPPRRRRLRRTPESGDLPDSVRVRPAFHPSIACPYRESGYRIGELGPPGLLRDDEFGRLQGKRQDASDQQMAN